MASNDDKNLPSRSRFGSRNDNTKSIKGNKETEYDLMNIDVKKAEKDIKQIFKTATNELSKFQKQQESQTKKLIDSTQKSYQNMFNNVAKNYEKSMSNLSSKNASSALGGGSSSRNSNNYSNQKDRPTNQLERFTEEFKRSSMGSLDRDRLSSNKISEAIGDRINRNFENGINGLSKDISNRTIRSNKKLEDQFAKLTDSQVKGMDRLNKITPVLKSAEILFNGVTVVLNKWLDRFTNGMNKITSTYESTYTKVSVITDINQKNYQDWQNETVKVLQEQGLDNNVTISEVMSELSKITSEGITDMQKASDMAMRNTVNQIINPFVDTASDAYTDLQNKFGTKFTDNITGMSQYLADIAGSNRVFKSSINDVLTTLEPVALASEKELMSGQEYAIVEQLVNSGMMSEREAVSLVSQASKVVSDQYGALTSGNVPQAVAVATGNANTMSDAIMSMLGTAASNGSSITNPIAKGAFNSAFGIQDWANQATNFAEIFSEAEEASGNALSTTLEDSYEKALSQLSGDQNNTAEQLKSNYAENASTWLATFKEAYPDWYSFLETIAKGVTTLIGLWAADKAIGGASKLLGGGGTGSGILKGAGSKIGAVAKSGLSKAGGGLLTGGTGSIASGLAVTGGALAGGAMAIKGGMDVYNDFSSGDVDLGTAMSGVGAAGGAVGAGALLALGASNPVGWVALAVGGLALAGREIYDLATQTGDISEELEKQTDSRVRNLEEQNKEEEKSLEVFKGQLEQEKDIDKQKKMIAEAGILSEEELQDEQYNNRDALIKLTDQYIESAKKLNEQETDAFKELEKVQNEQQNELSKKMFEILDKNYKDMTDEDKSAAADFAREYYEELKTKASEGTLSKDEEWRYNKINEAINKGDIDLYDDEFTSKELDYIMHKGSNSTSNDIVRSMLASQDFMTSLTGNESVRNSLGTGIYGRMDTSQVAQLITEAVNAENESDARKALDSMKELGATLDNIGDGNRKSIEEVMSKWGFESFAKGTDYVPYDGYPALLHEGESVLTSGASEILRSFGSGISKKSGLVSAVSRMFDIVTDPLKNIVGQSNSSESNDNNSSKDIVDAIYYQTTVLEKAINNMSTGTQQSSSNTMQTPTNRFALRTNYDSNMINLTPVMST